MKFTITHEVYEPVKDYLLITFEGEITIPILNEHAPKVVQAIRDYNCMRIVEDYRKATLSLDANEFIEAQNIQVDSLASKRISFVNVKRAMIVNENRISLDDMGFFEKMSVNNGQDLKVFTDMVQAINWIDEE